MTRKPIPLATQTAVLVQSRRRCSICYGLHRDTGLKAGQIAHLDHDNTNIAEDNLCFLCLPHHDEYDSRTSQRKGFSKDEVKTFRNQLYKDVGKAFSLPVHFGEITYSEEDPYAGQYIRIGGENASAEITLTPVPDSDDFLPQYHVSGIALYGTDRPGGPNIGMLNLLGTIDEDGDLEAHSSAVYPHSVRIKFKGDVVMVEESSEGAVHGMGVSFDGEYRKAPAPSA